MSAVLAVRFLRGPLVVGEGCTRRVPLWPGFLLSILICLWPAVPEASSLFRIGSDVTVEEGQRVNHVVTVRGQITVSGHVEGHVVAVGGSVVLTRRAVVLGNVVSIGGIVVAARGADVHGSVTELNAANLSEYLTTVLSEEWEGWSWIWAVFSLVIFLCVLIIALILGVLIPRPLRVVALAIEEDTLRVTLWGLLGLILVVPLAVLLTISVVGIVLIPLEMILVVSAGLMGFIAVAQLVGRRIYALFHKKGQPVIRETFWGLLALWLIGWAPYIGWIVKVLALMIGLGAVIFTRFGTHVSHRMAAAAGQKNINV
ncbi:MAG TPA: polymer-forming cytoskeletal protein [Syntrophales bacterium]|nr:polymer-forming cytoskeletal protein [Syntrophales bacterium]